MGKYTIHNDPNIDECINNYLHKIIEPFKRMPDVRSIILSGSFGKGEGSVLLEGNKIKPLRDFDLCVIFYRNPPNEHLIKIIRKKLEDDFCKIIDPDYPLMGNLIPEIKTTTLENINTLPDISTYDLKRCKVIYGEDIRSKIRWKLNDLPLRTNARALIQKAIALIGAFRTKYLENEIPIYLRDSFLRETSRAYIEICVGLCLLAKKYNSSCVKRSITIRNIYKNFFPDLYEKIPDLIEKIEASTKYKIDPSNNKLQVDLLDYWFTTRNDLGEILKFYYKRYLNVCYDNWIQFSKSIEEKLTKNYYIPIIKTYLYNRNLLVNDYIINILNLLYNIKENIDYCKNSIINRQFSLPLYYGISSPAIKIFFAAPLILFSIDRNGSINSKFIDKALNKLKFIKSNNHHKNVWEEARVKFLNLVFSVNMI
ncbi:MAG: hypothetical protein ACFFDN_02960 [Candidatus Hodarchaeota archaeon]